MKTTLTSILTLLSLPLLAQVTIDQSNFPLIASETDQFSVAYTNGVATPSVGAAQTWDYTGLIEASSETQIFTDATADPNFPDALNYFSNDLDFQSFIIPNNAYNAVDANGSYEYGRSSTDVTYSITSLTGGANDELNFPASDHVYNFEGGRINYLSFPATYQSSWTGTRIEPMAFNPTVVAFGLNNAPGEQVRKYTETREVVGYGTLIMPLPDGNASAPMDVLLVESSVTAVDSFYLGGGLAPASLLTAFGLTQGQTGTTHTFLFFKPELNAPLIRLGMDGQDVGSIGYRPVAASVPTGISSVPSNDISLYPNPISAGGQLTIGLNGATGAVHSVEIMDMTGRSVITEILETNSSDVRITVAATLPPGLYSVILRATDTTLISTSRMVVK